MKIKSGQLIDALDVVKDVSKTNLRNEINLVMFAFGQVIAENGTCYISTTFDHSLAECILPYDKLYTLVSAFSPSSNLNFKEGEQTVHLEFKKDEKKSKTKLALHLDKPFNYIDPPEDGWKSLPVDFVNGLKKCKVSLPTESLNPVLTCFGIKDDRIITSDDFRASQYTMNTGFGEEFVLSGEIGQLIINNKFSEYILEDNTISLKSNDVFAKAALSLDEFPNLSKKLFNYEQSIEAVRQDLTDAIDRSTLFADGLSEIDYAVNLTIIDDSLTINATNDYGKNTEVVDIETKCDEKQLSINPVYLSQVLKILSEKDVVIGITDTNGLVFKEDGFKHLLASYAK